MANTAKINAPEFLEENGETILILIAVVMGVFILYKFTNLFTGLFTGVGNVVTGTANTLAGNITQGDQLASQTQTLQQGFINQGADNPFDTTLYLANQNAPNLIDETVLNNNIDTIWNSHSNWFLSPMDTIMKVFDGVISKLQVSQLANAFQNKYGQNMLSYIDAVTTGNQSNSLFELIGNVTGDNQKGFNDLLGYVNNLPLK